MSSISKTRRDAILSAIAEITEMVNGIPVASCAECVKFKEGYCEEYESNVPPENQPDGCEEFEQDIPF